MQIYLIFKDFMKHIFLSFIFFITFLWHTSHASVGDKPSIISREEWGADTQYNSKESTYWKEILEKRSNSQTTAGNIEAQKKIREKNKKINDYLNENFSKHFSLDETIYYNFDEWYSYAWPLKYTNFVDSIIVHHTDWEYPDSLTWLQDIHKFHSISRQWWDIWYNFIIWYDGEIYEGKQWWDYISWAHSKYNNFWSVWIALLWNYHNRIVTNKQRESLESLIQYLVKKYGIDLSKKRYYHMNCIWSKCNTFPIETYLDNVLVGHRETWHTSCPWENLHPIIEEIRQNNLEFTVWFTPILRSIEFPKSREEPEYRTSQIFLYKKMLSWYEKNKLKNIQKTIKSAINSWKYDKKTTTKLKILNIAVVLSLKD